MFVCLFNQTAIYVVNTNILKQCCGSGQILTVSGFENLDPGLDPTEIQLYNVIKINGI